MRYVSRTDRSTSAEALVILAIISLLLSSLPVQVQGKTADEWKERTVYQIVSMACCSWVLMYVLIVGG